VALGRVLPRLSVQGRDRGGAEVGGGSERLGPFRSAAAFTPDVGRATGVCPVESPGPSSPLYLRFVRPRIPRGRARMGATMSLAPRLRRSPISLLIVCLFPAMLRAGTPVPDREGVEGLLKSLETAAAARDADAFLSAYDPAAEALIERTRGEVTGWFTLEDLDVHYRLAALTGSAD